jgi:hypothetical protein
MSSAHSSASISVLHDTLRNCTCVGSIGSDISTDSLTINLNSHGSRMKLRSKLVFFEFVEEGVTVYTIAQVSQILGLNPALDEHPVRAIIKRENSISSISGELDVSVATIKPKASYMLLPSNFASKSNQAEQSYTLVPTIVGSVPPTDTLVYLINENFLNQLFRKYIDRFFYVGSAYLSNVKIPLMFRHFGTGKFGMGNDAYHLLVTAKTGAGKTTISKMISICYARHPEMAQFIIDPAGEFANNARGYFGTEMFRLNLKESGHIKVDQVRRQCDFRIKGAKVFAACNEITRLSRPLQSRFRCLHLPPYNEEQFLEVSAKVLPELKIADVIGKAVWEQGGDIRDAISIGKLVRKDDGPEEVERILDTMIKYGTNNYRANSIPGVGSEN